MADEIEEFLRRAAMRRAAQQQAALQAAQQATQQPVYQPPPPTRPALASTYIDDEPVEVELVYDEPQLGAGVSSHVAQAMDNRAFGERARHMAEEVGLADDDMDARLHRKFDHQVGHLRSTTAATASIATVQPTFDEARQGTAGDAPAGAGDSAAQAAGVSAAEIVQLLRTPRNIRHAIILNEILTRPSDRW